MAKLAVHRARALTSTWIWTLLLAAAAATGCGGDGTVAVKGRVIVEGQPASNGRLSLMPVGPGKRAESLVADDGAFALQTGGAMGVRPGSYNVMFRRDLSSDGVTPSPRSGQASADELTVIYQSPPEKPIEIADSGAESLTIDIRRAEGWARSLSE